MDDREGERTSKFLDQMDNLTDIREHDVTYHVRVAIDLQIHVGCWYDVYYTGNETPPRILKRDDLLERPVCAIVCVCVRFWYVCACECFQVLRFKFG